LGWGYEEGGALAASGGPEDCGMTLDTVAGRTMT
jgi:hypothetical protein